VERYLHTCIDSIIGQSFHEYELILVDDGSPDGCPDICDEYASRDKRIKVIHKENGGLSDARNAGIHVASGKYLLFIDSDDYIANGSLEKIAAQTAADGDCDVAFLNAVGVLSDSSFTEFAYTYDKDMIYGKSQKEVLKYFVSISQYPVSACIKLISRQFFMDKNLFFTKGIVCEDLEQMIGLILSAGTFNCYDFPYYYYRCFREGSISSSNHENLFHSLLSVILKWEDLSRGSYSIYTYEIKNILAFEYCPLLWYYHSINKNEKAAYKKEMKKLAVLMSSSSDKRVRAVNAFYKLFGLSAASGFIHFYYTTKFKLKR